MLKHLLTTFAAVLILVPAALAQPHGGFMMAADKLELTEDQMNRLESMQIEHQKQMIELRSSVKIAKVDLKAMMRKAKVDEKAALAKQAKISDLKAQIAAAMLKHKLAMRSVLTAEQLDKWMKMKRDHMGPRGKRGQRGDFHRGGRSGCCQPGMVPGNGGGPGMGMWPGPGSDDQD